MKSVFRVSVVVLLFAIVAIWSPWNAWNLNLANLFGYAAAGESAGISVKSLSGEVKVFVDDREVGTATASQDPLSATDIPAGQHKVRLVRSSNPAGFYTEFSRIVNFEPGVDTVISYDLGPSSEFSEGHVLSARSRRLAGLPTLRVTVEPESASVLIDSQPLVANELKELDLSKQHTIQVTASGYEKLEFVILPDAQSDRDKLKNYDLELFIRLSLIPLEVN